jgi:hypothetical protein
MIKFILFVVLILPGKQPSPVRTEMNSLGACLAEVHELLYEPGNELKQALANGGSLQAGCVLVYPPQTPS